MLTPEVVSGSEGWMREPNWPGWLLTALVESSDLVALMMAGDGLLGSVWYVDVGGCGVLRGL